MVAIVEYDVRQLRRMDERLGMFEDGRVSLRLLIADVEFLLNAMEGFDATVREELRERWGVLEEVYSVAVAMHDGKVDAQSEVLVRKTVKALRERVGELLASAPA